MASALDAKNLHGLMARYDVGAPLECRPASHGIENSNYFVTTRNNGVTADWVLTILEQPSHSGRGYVPLLDLCHAAGLPVAPVVRNIAGDAVESVLGKQAMLAPKLPGAHIGEPTVAQLEALGRFMADFHRSTGNPGFEIADYPRHQRWLSDRAAAIRGRMAFTDQRLVDDCVHRTTSLLDRGDVQELPAGVVHGDLFRDNVLFEGPQLTGVLDFHHAARGYLVYDLAVAANDWCSRRDGSLDGAGTTALVAAYDRVRPLTAPEKCFFPGFLLYAALAFWLSRLAVALQADADAGVRFKDPQEFKAIVADRSERFFDTSAL